MRGEQPDRGDAEKLATGACPETGVQESIITYTAISLVRILYGLGLNN
jgi:hypothetical protein